MKLIDREPTQEMKAAGQAVIDRLANDGIKRHWQDVYAEGFKAMYDKAPEIQQEPVAHVYRNEYGTLRIDQQYLPSADSFPVFAFPPDAQAEIAKRDERIKELEFFQAQHIEKIDEQAERIASLIAAGAEYQRQFFEQSDQVKALSEDRDTWKARTEFSFQQRDELAAQNQQLREQFQMILDADYRKWEELANPYEFVRWAKSRSNHMLTLPDIASPVLNKVKAEAYREMATYFENYGPRLAIDQLRKMADAIEKGEKG